MMKQKQRQWLKKYLKMEKFEEEDPPEELLEFDDREDIV
jgi:hypothetical protein